MCVITDPAEHNPSEAVSMGRGRKGKDNGARREVVRERGGVSFVNFYMELSPGKGREATQGKPP